MMSALVDQIIQGNVKMLVKCASSLKSHFTSVTCFNDGHSHTREMSRLYFNFFRGH